MIRCPFCNHDNPSGTTHCVACKSELPQSIEAPAPNSAAALVTLIEQGKKIEAIKLYRERTGAGLKEAKDAVEAIERGERPALPQALAAASDGVLNTLEQEVVTLLKAGDKIAAIKLYREKTASGLADAKNAVETIANRNGIESKGSGCAGVLLCIALGIFAVRWLLP